MKTIGRPLLFLGLAVLLGGGLMAGCSGESGDSRTVGLNSAELFDRSYEYLLRGDPEFLRLAPNYSTLRPFSVDTAMVVESRSDHEGNKSPAPDFEEYMYIRLNRPMALRVIIADTAGLGIAAYDFATMPAGAYTVGSKGWPVPQIEATKGINWVHVYVIGDQRLRDRRQFKLDSRQHFLPMPQTPVPTKPT